MMPGENQDNDSLKNQVNIAHMQEIKYKINIKPQNGLCVWSP